MNTMKYSFIKQTCLLVISWAFFSCQSRYIEKSSSRTLGFTVAVSMMKKKTETKQLATTKLLVLNAAAIIQQSDLCSQLLFENYMIGECKVKPLTEKRDSVNSQTYADVDFTHW